MHQRTRMKENVSLINQQKRQLIMNSVHGLETTDQDVNGQRVSKIKNIMPKKYKKFKSDGNHRDNQMRVVSDVTMRQNQTHHAQKKYKKFLFIMPFLCTFLPLLSDPAEFIDMYQKAKHEERERSFSTLCPKMQIYKILPQGGYY